MVHPAGVEVSDANQVRAKSRGDVFDLGGVFLGCADRKLIVGYFALQRKFVREPLTAVLAFVELSEYIADMPGGIAQCVIFLGEAVGAAPGFQWFTVGLIKQCTFGAANAFIPP